MFLCEDIIFTFQRYSSAASFCPGLRELPVCVDANGLSPDIIYYQAVNNFQ